MDYRAFVDSKSQSESLGGFEPTFIPDELFDFQKHLARWSVRGGRKAIFADCGMGKSFVELVWSENVLRHTNKPVLILTPLAVSAQTVREGEKFGIGAQRVGDGGITGPRVYVTNYERLHRLEPNDFSGVVCDESSILKNYAGETRKVVTRFMAKMPYRLLATATAAPNDYIELGTSSEALGDMTHSDMLTRFFRQTDAKRNKSELDRAEWAEGAAKQLGGDHFAKLSYRVSQAVQGWRMKGHAHTPFWRWVASWARACRKPSDLGPFDDSRFVLPPLNVVEHVVKPRTKAPGMLFDMPAFGLKEERDERRRTLHERCEMAAELVNHGRPAVVWCHMNAEGDLLEELIPGAVQVSGSMSDDAKEEAYEAFSGGFNRVLIIKPKIGAFGLNWQHCADVVTFASHSYEQYYQAVRRCWRFGQMNPVNVAIISTEGEVRVRDSMRRKAEQADKMFAELVQHMNDAVAHSRPTQQGKVIEVPSW